MCASQTPLVALVIEDECLVRLTIIDELERGGWSVLEAATGEEALDLFHRHHVDLVLTDIELGGHLSGWDVAERLRARRPELAVVYASGNGRDRSRQVADAVFFGKPYDASEVVQVCRRLAAA